MSKGKVIQVIGPVVDVEFPLDGNLPELNDALTVKKSDGSSVTLEVALELGDGALRAISMGSTDGLQRGSEVINTKGPITVPVGKETLGRVFNVLGESIDGGADFPADFPRHSIHRDAPAYDHTFVVVKLVCSVVPVLVKPF